MIGPASMKSAESIYKMPPHLLPELGSGFLSHAGERKVERGEKATI
jgi:hypothetical protein